MLPLLLLSQRADAKDAKEFKEEKEARKKALRDAAGDIKETGVDVPQVFDMPEYSLSEESRTPNAHSRQGEGARKQKNI
ncbi:hypothetical protein FOA52_001356 [Chlamydomonas sp. UWO 241]|nr:hypothetical protein FOA52_001356 [Chlamydomonas sp. UWO 241]